jgi:hypothetical protein
VGTANGAPYRGYSRAEDRSPYEIIGLKGQTIHAQIPKRPKTIQWATLSQDPSPATLGDSGDWYSLILIQPI